MTSFNIKDLSLLLPDQVGETISYKVKENDDIDNNNNEKYIPRLDNTKKTRRYFPGQAPDWIDNNTQNNNNNNNSNQNNNEDEIRIEIDIPKTKEIDRRLARISQSKSNSSTNDNINEIGNSGRNRRRIYEAEVIEDVNESTNEFDIKQGDILEGDSPYIQKLEEQEENEEDIAARRQRIREKLASKRNEIDTKNTNNKQQQTNSGIISLAEKIAQNKAAESSSEYETDTDATDSDDEDDDDENNNNHKLLKPIFVSKQFRETIRQQEEQEKLEEIKQQNKLLKYEEKKHQTKVLLAEYLKKQSEMNPINDMTDNDSDAGLPDDYDDPNDEDEEYNLWKIREIKRIKREMELKEESIREQNEINRRRNMTDEERYQEDLKLGKFDEKEKKKWKFLQKYYHKGVFYMDEKSTNDEKNKIRSQYNSEVVDVNKSESNKVDARLREYDEPTLEDKFNKDTLPAILQVKKFGMRGRTKYTHLVDQDTTDYRNPLKTDNRITSNYMSKRAGVGDLNIGKKKQRME